MTTIPETAADLTPAWLSEALGVDVTEVDATPVGTGQMGDSVRLRLDYAGDTDLPPTMVAKLAAADPTSRGTALALRSYEIEVRFYQQLAPGLPIRTPRSYHSDIDPATAAFVLVLEDMAPAEQGDQLAGCSVERARVAVDELVKLHAPRWGDASLRELDWLYRDPDASRLFMSMLLPQLWGGFTERYADRLGPEVHETGGALFAGIEGFLQPTPDHATVLHGDYRLDNLLFGEAVPVTVVDWQTATVGAGPSDLAYFVGAGLLEDDRRAVEDELVRRYHDALLDAGVDGYGWDACWEDYRRGTFAGLVMAVAASMMVERTERGDDMFMTMAHRHARHILDLDAPALLAAG